MRAEQVLPFFNPQILDQYSQLMQDEVAYARFSSLSESLSSLRDQQEITVSLHKTLTSLNEGSLAGLVESYKKVNASFPHGRFVLSKPQEVGYVSLIGERATPKLSRLSSSSTTDIDEAKFFLDGHHGFVLGFAEEDAKKPLWLATAGFSCGRDIPAVMNSEGGESMLSPVIVQLQGPSNNTFTMEGNKERASNILRQFRWERMLVDIVITWADQNRIPSLYMLPASKNRWLAPSDKAQFERLRMRYDVTAERMGFRMQPNGLYGLSLL